MWLWCYGPAEPADLRGPAEAKSENERAVKMPRHSTVRQVEGQTLISKISKISGDEEAEVSIPLFISGFTR